VAGLKQKSAGPVPRQAGYVGLVDDLAVNGQGSEEAQGAATYRVEHDSMGEVRVPIDARWGAQSQRAVENFPISGTRVEAAIIAALAMIKGAAAQVNGRLGLIPEDAAGAIAEAAAEIAAGAHLEHFPVDVYQTGSGTSTNMNMNEVLANLAGEKLGREIRPNNEPNTSQSSNDTFPSAIHLAAAREVVGSLVPALEHLAATLRAKAAEMNHVVKSGRTHLMDATPVTLGQEFGGFAAAMERGIERLGSCLPRLAELPLGGTAVGTGLNAPPGFAAAVIQLLAEQTGLPLTEARDHFEAQGTGNAFVEASGVLRVVAISIYKIANDLRWMSSGPRAGLAEIHLPDLQPGSSIMPGKVNPVVPEAVCQVAAQVVGNDAAVTFGAAVGSRFELNTMLPVIGRNLLESVRLLASVARALADKCAAGIVADEERCLEYALSSPSIVTALNPYIGYEAAAKVVKKMLAERKDARTVVLEMGLLDAEQLDKALDVGAMARGGIIGADRAPAG
jgi:fumarate hydratase class II